MKVYLLYNGLCHAQQYFSHLMAGKSHLDYQFFAFCQVPTPQAARGLVSQVYLDTTTLIFNPLTSRDTPAHG